MKSIFLPLAIVAAVIFGALHFGLLDKAQAHEQIQTAPAKVYTSTATMAAQIQQQINANPGVDISVSILDLKTGQHLHYGISDPFEAASTTKVLTACEFLHTVEQGNETMDVDLGGETASDAMQAMIVNSDDTAWQLFTNERGEAALENYADSVGITNFNFASNTLTTDDVTVLFSKLYKGQLLNKADTSLLLGYMKQANYAYLIPSAVPAGVNVYHKAGLLEDRLHDSAIIDDGHHAYILSIFTNGHGIGNLDIRAQTIDAITAATVSHFVGKA